jgi:hypothetical protein
MLKKTVTYTNLDGQAISKDLYFNISTNDIAQKEALSDSKWSAKLQEIAKSDKLSEIYPMVMEFIEEGYGIRTEDGDFEKDPQHTEKFRRSMAFQALMEDLLLDTTNNGTKLADFLAGMMPAELMNKAREMQAVPGFRPGADTSRPTPPVAGQPVQVTPSEPPLREGETPNTDWAEHQQQVQVDQQEAIRQYAEPRNPELPGQQPFQQ